MRFKKTFYQTKKKEENKAFMYFEVRLTDGSEEKIPKKCLSSFMKLHRNKVCSYIPCLK